MHIGTINLAGLRSLYDFKSTFLSALKCAVSACGAKIGTIATPDEEVAYFSALRFESVSGMCLDGTVSVRRRRFWTRPPRLLLLCPNTNRVYDTWLPTKPVSRITFVRTVGSKNDENVKFYFGKRGSSTFSVNNFAYADLSSLRKVSMVLQKSSSWFGAFDLRTKTAARRTCVRLPMTCVKRQYRHLLYMSVLRLSLARFKASNEMQRTMSRYGTMTDPDKRSFEFTRDLYREGGQDEYQERYGSAELKYGDSSAVRSLSKRDGANLLEHIPRAFVKSLCHLLSVMLGLDLKANRVRFEVAIMESSCGGLDTYISKTIKYLHKSRHEKLGFRGQVLSSTNKALAAKMIESIVLHSCGRVRLEKNLFDNPDAIASIFLCRKISCLISSFLEHGISSVDVSMAPLAKGWCHGHFHRVSLNRMIRNADYEMDVVEHLTDIIEDPKMRTKFQRIVTKDGVTETRTPGAEFQSDGSSVVFAYDTTISVEKPCVLDDAEIEDAVASPVLALNNRLKIFKHKNDLLSRDVTDGYRWKILKERLERESGKSINSFCDLVNNFILVISDPGSRDCRCLSVLVRYKNLQGRMVDEFVDLKPISARMLNHLCGKRVTTNTPEGTSTFRRYQDDDDLDTQIRRRNGRFSPKSKRQLKRQMNARIRRCKTLKDYVLMIQDQVHSSLSSLPCSESERNRVLNLTVVYIEGAGEFKTVGPTFETQKLMVDTFAENNANGGDAHGRKWIFSLWTEIRCSKACESCKIEFRPPSGPTFLKKKSLLCDMAHVRGNDRQKIWCVFILIHSYFIVFDRSKSSLHIVPHHQAMAALREMWACCAA